MTTTKPLKRGYFGIGVHQPKWEENIGTLWRSAFIFGASFIFTIGKRYHKQPTDTPKSTKHIPLYNYENYEDFMKHLPENCKLICVELDEKSQPLNKFVHPERAIYLLGAEDYGIPKNILKENLIVQIPTEKEFSLNVAVSGSIILSDRYLKSL